LGEIDHVNVRIDGASRGNPGRAGIGIVVEDANGKTIERYSEYIGMKTNNEAEYAALRKALELASRHCKKHITILSDSELLVKQRQKQYKTRKRHLKSLAMEVAELEGVFEKVDYKHVPREQNREADRLANLAIDSKY
jgi:ribonuclease HI